jgi:hypothetical protein
LDDGLLFSRDLLPLLDEEDALEDVDAAARPRLLGRASALRDAAVTDCSVADDAPRLSPDADRRDRVLRR